MCQLFSMASGILGTLNPMQEVILRVSTGNRRNMDYSITPEFTDYRILADLQSKYEPAGGKHECLFKRHFSCA